MPKKQYRWTFPKYRMGKGKARWHPVRIHGKDKQNYYYVQFTHSKKTGKHKNIKLKRNPNKRDRKDSYVLSKPKYDKKKVFKKKLRGWRLRSIEDIEKVRKIKKKKHN